MKKIIITAERLKTVTREKQPFAYMLKFLQHKANAENVNSSLSAMVKIDAVAKTVEYDEKIFKVLTAEINKADSENTVVFSHYRTALKNVLFGRTANKNSSSAVEWLN